MNQHALNKPTALWFTSMCSSHGQKERVTGFEPATFSLGSGQPIPQPLENTATYKQGESNPSDINSDTNAKLMADPHLQRLIDAWPDLPDAVKAGSVAMVRASRG